MARYAVALVAAMLLVAGCGGGSSGSGQPDSASSTLSCQSPPPRHAWAEAVSTGGQELWRTSLATDGGSALQAGQVALVPVLANGVAVVSQDAQVHGLRPADGRPLWSWGDGQPVYGMWRWQDLVVVLTDQVGAHSELTGLDAATGQVRWTARLGASVLGNAVATADGGLAMVTVAGSLRVVSLADGRSRWSTKSGASPALAAAAHGVVVFAGAGRATGYDDRTGRVRWRVTGLPKQAQVRVADGLAIVTSAEQGGTAPTAMTAIAPGSGHVAWRFNRGAALTLLGAGPGGLAISYSDPAEHLYLVNPATGRPRWQVATVAQVQGGSPLITATDVVSVEGRTSYQVVDRDASTGQVRWRAPASSVVVPLVADGPLVVVLDDPVPAGQSAQVRAYRLAGGGLVWQATLATFVQVPLAVLPDGFLVQPADLGYACPV